MSQRNERSLQPDISSLPQWLIRLAARRAPGSLSPRLEEEWLADLESRSSAVSRLGFAVGCCWATAVIVSEQPRNRVAAANPAATARVFISITDRSFGYFSLRSGTLFLIAGLHAALFYGLITTLGHTHRPPIPYNLENEVLKPVPRNPLPLPLPGPTLETWTVDVPPPIAPVAPGSDPDREVTTTVAENPPEQSAPPQPEAPTHIVRQVVGGPDTGFPDTADFYPSLSRHMEEQGISIVQVCVDPRGRLISDPTTVRGSGSTRLDEGALKLARAGSGHYRATTQDGRPVSSCYSMGIRFQLRN
jgi:TonB family protein